MKKRQVLLLRKQILSTEKVVSVEFKKIERILKNGNQIYLAGIGDFREPRQTGLLKRNFPKHGLIEDNGRSLQFIAIKNERNQCFAAFSADEKPCPPEPFPLKK